MHTCAWHIKRSALNLKALVTDLKALASNQGKICCFLHWFSLSSLIDSFWCFWMACRQLFLLLERLTGYKRRPEVLLSCQMSFKMSSCSKTIFSWPHMLWAIKWCLSFYDRAPSALHLKNLFYLDCL